MHSHHGYYKGGSYTPTVQRELVPGWLDLAALIRGQPSPRGGEGQPFRYLELGSGQGLGLCLIAAAHPEGQFLGVDVLADHIAHSRWLATELGLRNVRFLQADFLDLAADPAALVCADGEGGPFAYAVAHGIFTWVAPLVQEALLEVARGVLQPGGLFYCSYNTLPGWLSRTPFQMLQQLERQRLDPADPGQPFERAARSLRALLGPKEQPSRLALALPSLGEEIERIAANSDVAYLCGEFANAGWQPLYVGQMHPRCEARQLSYLGSATLPELFEQFLSEPQGAVVRAEVNPLIREALFDLAIHQGFRRDLFVKGALPLPAPLRQEALAALRLQPLAAAAIPECDYVFANSFGEFHADPSLCRAVEARLAVGACSLGQLGLELAMEPEDLLPGLAILLDAARITLERGPAAAAALAPAQAANRRLRVLIQARAPYAHLVAPTSGGQVSLNLLECLYLDTIEQDVAEADWPLCLLLGFQASGAVLRDRGVAIEDPLLQQQKLVEDCLRFRIEKLPLLRALGALGS